MTARDGQATGVLPLEGSTGQALGPTPFGTTSRTAGSVSGQIRWHRVHGGFTRYRATATSFAWPVKVLLGAPPWLTLAWWAWVGVFNHPLFALIFAVPLTWAALWWTRQVWARHRSHDLTDKPTYTATDIGPAHQPSRPHLTLGIEPRDRTTPTHR